MKAKKSQSFKKSSSNNTEVVRNKPSTSTLQLRDNREFSISISRIPQMKMNGNQGLQLKAINGILNSNSPIQKMELEEEEPLQGRFETIQKQGLEEEELMQGKFKTIQKIGLEEEEPLQGKFKTIQKMGLEEEESLQGKFETIQKKENNTGLPDNLKSGIENLSGYSMDDVKVHYNSDKPATLQAHAFAQGTNIHIASGQEKHLPHEAWHVVQQKQGRVKPTIQLQGKVNVNDDAGLEKEADVMGGRATRKSTANPSNLENQEITSGTVQRALGFEFETGWRVKKEKWNGYKNMKKMEVVHNLGDGLKVEVDVNSLGESVIEMVLDPPVQENDPGKMGTVLNKFLTAGDALENVKNVQEIKSDKINGLGAPKGFKVWPLAGGFKGNPQITGGVKFDKLFNFLHQTSDPNSQVANPDYQGIYDVNQYVTSYDAKVQNIVANHDALSEELKGLLVLLSSYIKHADSGTGPMFNYAKLISNSFLLRTDFGTIFNLLPANEKMQFVSNRQAFVDLVLNIAGLPGTGGNLVYDRGIRKSYNPTSPDYNVNIVPTITGLNISRENWLKGITQGNDNLSAKFASGELEKQLEGLGALGPKLDKTGPNELAGINDPTGIIMEFRNMRQGKTHHEFINSIAAIFQYLGNINV